LDGGRARSTSSIDTTRSWKFFAKRLSLDNILKMQVRDLPSELGVSRYDMTDGSEVGLVVGPFRVGIEALNNDVWNGWQPVDWSMPARWLVAELRERMAPLRPVAGALGVIALVIGLAGDAVLRVRGW
jgi:hypothetical protein